MTDATSLTDAITFVCVCSMCHEEGNGDSLKVVYVYYIILPRFVYTVTISVYLSVQNVRALQTHKQAKLAVPVSI